MRLTHGLMRHARIDTASAQKQELLRAVLKCRLDHISLHHEVL
jgi:hypothetical protein